jgi:hypothetical protein
MEECATEMGELSYGNNDSIEEMGAEAAKGAKVCGMGMGQMERRNVPRKVGKERGAHP